MRRLWTIDSLDRRILAISVPALGSLLVEPIYVLTDTAVVGRLGTAPLGGLALASTVLNTLVWVFNFLSYGDDGAGGGAARAAATGRARPPTRSRRCGWRWASGSTVAVRGRR